MDLDQDAYTHHISQQFNDELEQAKNHLLEMGGLVERQVGDAIKALIDADSELGDRVQKKDDQVNRMEIEIDEECTRIIARRQPAASDLRLVIATSKAVSDLERIGDESAKIGRLAMKLCEEGEAPRGYVEIRHIGDRVRRMTQEALTAFARLDVDTALNVAREDKDVDREYESAMRELVTYMMEDPRSIKRVMNIIWSLRSLERIGDHARNIAENVIYLVKGTDVRHISIDEMQRQVQDD
ncbi:phosphate signaling complex protein PhoU [Bermanella marisrubri]|uniref:Phosphate-specific transport system accessory protein PhoU n=1 Tax=Bermanella marisrubri TaxID=207949 RepID=Q1N3Y5_9GAMM|nr:phosphate signaling complex protein PhoU [Bermanella marisrubri]EAT13080.1 phosphate uptake regulatory protein PhoU [Oceanobacter sp. RED65] [Bermanella marisrubri]QIZ82804.1 phosphate signaling complex protein PhoU [Bermanella marisrubri]